MAALAFVALPLDFYSATAQEVALRSEMDRESCTAIAVGKDASSDGSVMTSQTCDSNYRTWVTIEPRKQFSLGDTEPIYVGALHTEEPWDQRNLVERGRIPVTKQETYRFLNTAYPCMNEKQLAIGESTYDGRRELLNTEGLFYIEELERIALQYCDNARDAIRLIGRLAETYGYADWGETLMIADKNEVWQMELQGSGPGKPSCIWAAARIPDGHVGISANIARIPAIDFNNPDMFMYSSDLKERAKRLKLWDGKGPLVFYKVVSADRPFSIREFFVLSSLAPSLNLSMDMEELPFTVKPEEKVTPERLFAFFRETYEGTEYDMSKNLSIDVHRRIKTGGIYPNATYNEYDETVYPISNFMSQDLQAMINKIAPGTVTRRRTIAVIQCSYSHICRLRNWLPDEIGGVAYLSFDNPAQSPRIPIYSGATELPASFQVCGQARYREDAAVWAFRETNRIATIYWDKTRKILEPESAAFEKQMMENCAAIESEAGRLLKEGKKDEAVSRLNKYTSSFATMVMSRWRELKGKVLEIFVRSM
jgi:Dipeptidase